VLAFNSDKDIYKEGERGEVHIGVLDDDGKIVCDADVTLTVSAPDGSEHVLSTENDLIETTGSCGTKQVGFIEPDYKAEYFFMEGVGEYVFTLSADNGGGVRSLQQKILVTSQQVSKSQVGISDISTCDLSTCRLVTIRRTSATRLYPFGYAPMTVEVEFLEDYRGDLIDIVPAGFVLRNVSGDGVVDASVSEDSKTIVWNGAWNAGEVATFSYEYDAPDVSPEFYTVGPLQNSGGSLVEDRVWMIANDAGESPGGITSGLILWLDANDLDGDGAAEGSGEAGLNAGVVETWKDKSGAGNDVTQSTSANRPTFVENSFAFVPQVDFDGSNDRLLDSNGVLPSSTTDLNIFLVAHSDNASGPLDVMMSENEDNMRVYLPWTDGVIYFDAGNVTDGRVSVAGNITVGENYIYKFTSENGSPDFQAIARDGIQIIGIEPENETRGDAAGGFSGVVGDHPERRCAPPPVPPPYICPYPS